MEPENNDRGITEELIKEILDNVCLILDIKEPVEPILPENPTTEQQTAYDKAKAEYDKEKEEYDNIIALLTLYIKMICSNILIKTNRRMFPPDLKYVVINLVKDKFDSNNKSDPELQIIKSMSEYDRSVNFGVADTLQTRLNLIAERQLNENESLINKFKLLYKT